MDRSGNLILKKPVKLAQNFSEELAFVYDEFYYCVDRSGNLRFQLDKNCVYVEPFQNGMALIQFSNGKYSYINQEGLMMSYQFDKAFSFIMVWHMLNLIMLVHISIKWEKYVLKMQTLLKEYLI